MIALGAQRNLTFEVGGSDFAPKLPSASTAVKAHLGGIRSWIQEAREAASIEPIARPAGELMQALRNLSRRLFEGEGLRDDGEVACRRSPVHSTETELRPSAIRMC